MAWYNIKLSITPKNMNVPYRTYVILEIKPCGLGSKIRDMEAEWMLRVITDKFLGEPLVSRTGAEG